MIGDEVDYGRLKNRLLRTIIGGVGVDNLSSALKSFKEGYDTYDAKGNDTRHTMDVQFYQGQHQGIVYFFRKDRLPLLKRGTDGIDGTFECVRN